MDNSKIITNTRTRSFTRPEVIIAISTVLVATLLVQLIITMM